MMKRIALILACLIFCTLAASCGSGSTYTPGITTENGYVSDWLGLEFVPAKGMAMASADELERMMGLTDEDKENFDWSQVVEAYEMMATDEVSGDVVIVMAEKLFDKSMTVEQFAENLKREISGDGSLGTADSFEVNFGEYSEVSIAGEKYTRFEYEMPMYWLTFRQVNFIRKVEDRMVVIMVVSSNEGAEEMFLSCFRAK